MASGYTKNPTGPGSVRNIPPGVVLDWQVSAIVGPQIGLALTLVLPRNREPITQSPIVALENVGPVDLNPANFFVLDDSNPNLVCTSATLDASGILLLTFSDDLSSGEVYYNGKDPVLNASTPEARMSPIATGY